MGYSNPLLTWLAEENSFSSFAPVAVFYRLLDPGQENWYCSIISTILSPFSRQMSLHISGKLAAILVKSRNPAPEKLM